MNVHCNYLIIQDDRMSDFIDVIFTLNKYKVHLVT